jgi:acetyl esterase/lipase
MKPALLLFALAALLPAQQARVYKSTPQGELKIHLFAPEGGAAKRPAALFFFGGGFRSGRPEQFFPFAQHLAQRGMVAASAEYRVSERHKTTVRDAVEDCRDAMIWMRRNAGELGIDTSRLAFGGGSAGGGCALAASYDAGPGPGAWLLFNPVTDMAKYDTSDLSPGPRVRGGDAPALMLFGSDDGAWLPPARGFAARYWAAGNRMDLLIAAQARHGFFNRDPWLVPAMEAMDRFLVTLGWLKGASGLKPGAATFERSPRVPLDTVVLSEFEYAPGLHLDLYLPPGSKGPAPVVMWVHGGAWRQGSRANPPAFELLEAGYAVASVSYRLSQQARFPAQMEDVTVAARWLRIHCAAYGCDGTRIAAWGASAGGHLVALLGARGSVQAVVDYFGPTDLLRMGDFPSDMDHNAPDSPESQLIGAPIQQRPDLAAKANPITYVTRDAPPFLIVHGDQDRLVPLNQSELLHAALVKAGADSTLIILRGAGHGGPAFSGLYVTSRILAFLDRHLRR